MLFFFSGVNSFIEEQGKEIEVNIRQNIERIKFLIETAA